LSPSAARAPAADRTTIGPHAEHFLLAFPASVVETGVVLTFLVENVVQFQTAAKEKCVGQALLIYKALKYSANRNTPR